MPGAWEYINNAVLVSILTRGTVATKWAESLRVLQLPEGSKVSYLSGMPFDHARNTAVDNMLNNGFQWLMFLDDDVTPPPDAIFRLLSTRQDIVSGVYCRRAEPINPVMLKSMDGNMEWVRPTVEGLVEVDYVGAGCLLINRKVFERMPRPWFNWRLDARDLPPEERVSEDFAFCRDAKRNGFRICVYTEIKCGHIGLGYSDPHTYTFRPSEL